MYQFEQLEQVKEQYEKLFTDHEEMQEKYEKELERILEDNRTQQKQLKQQLMISKEPVPIVKELQDETNNLIKKDKGLNFCVVNQYANGLDRIGLHKDNEKDLSPDYPIVCFSFEATRDIIFKREVAKTARLLNKPEDNVNPPELHLPIREAHDNEPPLVGNEELAIDDGNFVMNAVNIQPVLEEEVMDVNDAEPILEDNAAANPILEDNAAANPVLEDNAAANPVLEDNAAADPILEDNAAADPVLEDNPAADPVMVGNYMEPADGKKEEFYPNNTYARKRLDHEKYAVDHVGNEMLNPFTNRYASYPLEKDVMTHKVQFVPRNADGSFNFIKDKDGMIIYPFDLTAELPISPQNEEEEGVYFRINNIDHYPRDTEGKLIYVNDKEGLEVPPFSGVNGPL
ncbi:hypothetical protein TNCV_1420591 [Trichonephila clavipes]|nr:hypothetical protein TNCV_1420591 [Trichonephila clavipes]